MFDKPLLVIAYEPARKSQWDRLVSTGKNSTFLFFRDYIDYLSDRFFDFSLMIYDDKELVALLPANKQDDYSICTHQGLEYGGLVIQVDASLLDVLVIFQALLKYLENKGIKTLKYKRIPYFYNTLPDDEIGYAMFLLDANLIRRDCAQVVFLPNPLPIRKGRMYFSARARKAGVGVTESTISELYWPEFLNLNLLQSDSTQFDNSIEDIKLLSSIFPDNIRLFTATLSGEIQASIVIYETPTVAHAQHSALASGALASGALNMLTEWLIVDRYANKRYFSFGISNAWDSHSMNHTLLRTKESFGGRTCSQDVYKIDVKKHACITAALDQD